MEDTLKITSEHCDSWITTIEIDNSTNYKDFNVSSFFKTNQKEFKELTVSLNTEGEKKIVTINNVALMPRELELLKEFLNQ